IKEEVEQIDELSRETLTSYKGKVVSSYGDLVRKAIKSKTPEEFEKNRKKAKNRAAGALGAAERLGKMKNEEVEQIDERSLSDEENENKEDYVRGMKKKMKAFKERYGKKAKSVMYATATKMAKEK
ncbi:MAG: hypothetical protein ACR2HS_05065, partial [Gammaproteobacteria bacterium]